MTVRALFSMGVNILGGIYYRHNLQLLNESFDNKY